MQSKKQDLRSCWAGNSIAKWTSVSTEFNQHNLQVWKLVWGLWCSVSHHQHAVGGNPLRGQPWSTGVLCKWY